MAKPKSELNTLVFICGYATSAVTLALLYLLNRVDFNIMGFYFWFIVPARALFTGIAAGLGYCFGSYWSNVRVSGKSMAYIAVLGVLTFFLAHYVTFRGLMAENNIPNGAISFTEYFQFQCENMTYQIDAQHHPKEKGTELGKWGYLFKLIECLGFAAGGVIPLIILKNKPYCDDCCRYLKRQHTAAIISDETKESLKKKKKIEKAAVLRTSATKLLEAASPIFEALAKSEYKDNLAALNLLPTKPPKGCLGYIALELRKCPECDQHVIIATMVTQNVNGQPATNELRRINGAVKRNATAET